MIHKKIKDILILELIGKGSFSDVYRGVIDNKNQKKQVAVKVIKKTQINISTIESEIKILKQINHKNVVNYINQINTANNTYIITELCNGGTLRKFINKNYKSSIVPEKHAKKYFKQICLGVKALHSKNIVHRDLKLDNIFINNDYSLKIGDFGFAKLLQMGDILSSFKGTPVNMAPEIFKIKKNELNSYDKKCDVWSLGTILYEMVFGKIIGKGIKTLSDLQNLLMDSKRLEFPEGFDVGERCLRLLRRMLEKEPSVRYGIEEILQDDWMCEDVCSLNSMLLLKSFYDVKRGGIKSLNRVSFREENLKMFICLDFKLKVKREVEELCLNVKNVILKIYGIIEFFLKSEENKEKSELIDLLNSKIFHMINKLSNLQNDSLKNVDFIKYLKNLFDQETKKHEFEKIYTKSKNELIILLEHNLLFSNQEVTTNLFYKFFELAENNLREEYTMEKSNFKEKEDNICFQKILIDLLDIANFDFIGVVYDLKFNVEIKNIDFDFLNIDNYLEDIFTVEMDDFEDNDYLKLNNIFCLKVDIEYLKNYPNDNIRQSLKIFKDLLLKKIENEKLEGYNISQDSDISQDHFEEIEE